SARYRVTRSAPKRRLPDGVSVHGVRLLPANASTSAAGWSRVSALWIAPNQSQSAVPPYAPPSNGCSRSAAIRWRYAQACSVSESPNTATPRRALRRAVVVARVTAPGGTILPMGGRGGIVELLMAATADADGASSPTGAVGRARVLARVACCG